MTKHNGSNGKHRTATTGITRISVQGYKSLYDECNAEIRPLTILAGANSSGKSSIMQPLLMLKQTLEASYDPGPLLLNGPNVQFTSADQALSHFPGKTTAHTLRVRLESNEGQSLSITFKREPNKGI